jgi:TIR domain-containing protein/pentapeptide repeat protein
MANEEHLARLKQGVDAWNQWRNKSGGTVPDLSRANLDGADLFDVDFHGVDLHGANLDAANLSRANLHGADLHDADLRVATLHGAILDRANLYGTDFHGADLRGASLREATLHGADLHGADLRRASLREAHIAMTQFGDVDLSMVQGLETVVHSGPSTIGIDTLYRSHGNIPEVFLRGAGVPEDFIPYIKSLVGRPFEFYSCFISYSSRGQEFAERLHADLQNKGVRCWFAPHDSQGGRKLHEQIDQATRVHERLLLILSPYSMNSEWVKTEIAKARQHEVLEQRFCQPSRHLHFLWHSM